MTISDLRQAIREEINGKRYWGHGGAGIMFTCTEDDTILLLKRAGWVAQGGTWVCEKVTEAINRATAIKIKPPTSAAT